MHMQIKVLASAGEVVYIFDKDLTMAVMESAHYTKYIFARDGVVCEQLTVSHQHTHLVEEVQ